MVRLAIYSRRNRFLVPLWCLILCCAATAADAADLAAGKQIYISKCAGCHGESGQGAAEHYDKPLAGDLPVAELAAVIVETMPEDDPETCVGADAENVAAYIFETFYSEDARARNNRPRVELSRLTVGQYHSAIADLLGELRDSGSRSTGDGARGLRGEYFKDRNFRDRNRVLDRRDPTIDFDFGESSPDPDKIEAKEFGIRWSGGLLAPVTGDYELVIRTENGVRLWVNDTEQPLIDGWVRSGTEVELRASVRLLGERVYPLRLELFKSEKAKETSASVSLLWRPPHYQVEQLIPERCLSPHEFAPVALLETPFPPDDRSIGYERGTSISKQWDEATTYGALEVAGMVAANLRRLAGGGDAEAREARVRELGYRFAERAFRRPLSQEEKAFFVDQHFDEADHPESAVKRVVLLVLKSPRFLYREVAADGVDAYNVASRMAFGLWDSLPDQQLLDAAGSGQLLEPEQVTAQAERMLADPRARAKLREFFHQWLQLDRMDDVSKDSEQYAEFSDEIAADLRTSLDLFLDDVIFGESDFRQLLLADALYLNGRLAKLYGADLPEDAPFQRVALDPQQRAGLLSHPFLMAGFAYYSDSSPIHRGVFVSRSLLGRSLRPPPEAVAPLAPDLHPDLTTRERVTLQTSPTSCQSCHGMINPLGFALEHYDAIGRYRTEEKGRAIDALGSYRTLSGEEVQFRGARELASVLAGSQEVHRALVEQLFHHVVKQPIRAYDPARTEELQASFSQNNFNIRRLLVDIIRVSALDGTQRD